MRSKYLVTLSIGVEIKDELLIGGGVRVCNIFGSL